MSVSKLSQEPAWLKESGRLAERRAGILLGSFGKCSSSTSCRRAQPWFPRFGWGAGADPDPSLVFIAAFLASLTPTNEMII